MANRYWVGGGASTNWAATGNTNWSASSGGSNNASVPGVSDFCIFDGNGGSANGTSNVGASIAVQGVDFTGFTGTLTMTAAAVVTINTAAANALKFATGMTVTAPAASCSFTFTHTSGTAVITSNGKSIPSIIVNGAGGTTQQADNLTISASNAGPGLTITSGVYDMNGFSLVAPIVNFSGSTTRSFLLGSSITIGGNIGSLATPWGAATTTNLTFTKNSCTITILAPSTNIQEYALAFGGLTYNGVTLNPITGMTGILVSGTNTFGSLSIGAGNFIILPNNSTQTISTAFNWVGTAASPITIGSGNPSGNITISCPSGACTFSWCIILGGTFTGGASFTATNSFATGPLGVGITHTPPADASSAGIASSVWTDLLAGTDFQTAGSVGALLAAMVNLGYIIPAIGRGTVTTGGSTTSIPTSAFAPAPSASVPNQFAGRNVLFDANTATVALRGQWKAISASSASATPTLTVAALTAAPAAGDTFSVV